MGKPRKDSLCPRRFYEGRSDAAPAGSRLRPDAVRAFRALRGGKRAGLRLPGRGLFCSVRAARAKYHPDGAGGRRGDAVVVFRASAGKASRAARLSDLRASDACGDPEKHYRPGRRGHQRLRACAPLPCRSQALKTHIRKMRQPNRKPAGLAFFVIRYLPARRRFLPPRPRAGYLRQS